MKRIFGTLLTIAVVMLMVGTLCAEEEFTDENGTKCFAYSGRVVELKTEVVDLAEMIESLQVKGGEFIPPVVILHTYTVTYFTVWPVDDNAKSYQEKIENGDGKDMSAMIAVVQEAFTSGEMIHVVKCYEPVEPLYDKLDALNNELAQLQYVYIKKYIALRSWFYSLPEVKKVQELFNTKQISYEEYKKRIAELQETTGFNKQYGELKIWRTTREQELTGQIASLEKEIEYILNNPKLVSVSLNKGFPHILKPISESEEPEPTATAE